MAALAAEVASGLANREVRIVIRYRLLLNDESPRMATYAGRIGSGTSAIAPPKVFSLCVALVVSGMVAQGRRVVAADEAAKPETFSVAKNGKAIVLPVRIDDVEYPFLLDTGAAISMFNPSLKPMVGEAVRSRRMLSQFNGIGRKEILFRAPHLSLGDTSLAGVSEVLCSEGLEVPVIDGQSVKGMLGVDALRALVVRIDFDRGELTLLPAVPSDAGHELAIQYHHEVPCARFPGPDGLPELFQLDTGFLGTASGSRRCLRFQAQLDAGEMVQVDDALIKLCRGKTRLREGRVGQFRFGRFVHHDLRFVEGVYDSVSLNYLSRYIVTFDFPRDRVYLSPGKQFDRVCKREEEKVQKKAPGQPNGEPKADASSGRNH